MALQKTHASPLALAVGSSLESQVRGATSMVRSLSDGVGPEARDVSSFGEFYACTLYTSDAADDLTCLSLWVSLTIS